MKQLVVAPSFPYSTHTFVTREIAATIAAGHDVTVLAPTTGDAEGQVLANQLGIDMSKVVYLNFRKCPLWAPSLRRYSHRVRKAAMRSFFGFELAQRRKTFFAYLLAIGRLREVRSFTHISWDGRSRSRFHSERS